MNRVDELIRLARKGRRAEQRGEAIRGCITAMVVFAVQLFLDGMSLMLACHLIHHHWWAPMPTLGFWWAALIAFFVKALIRTERKTAKS